MRFFLVNEDRGPGTATRAEGWLKDHDVTLTSTLDPSGAIYRKLTAAAVLPVRVVIGPQGQVLLRTVGYTAKDAGFPTLRSTIAKARQD